MTLDFSTVPGQLTFDPQARSNLKFPLGRKNLSVDTRDVHTGVHASTVVSLDDVTTVDLASSNTTVVRTLGTWETTLGPAVRGTKFIEQCVFLLQTEPRL
jgi:hypothetical protein